jgi:predicted nucleic-acid-binding Zn-ribbon protein
MMAKIVPCPNCGGKNLYKSENVSAGGGHAPDYLPGLGRFWSAEKLNVVLCKDCGLLRFFARESATAKVDTSTKWTRVV